MKQFIIEIIYQAEPEEIAKVRDEHRKYLLTGYEKGLILMSGPQVPQIGGLVVMKGNSMEEIHDFFANDPYNLAGLTKYLYFEFEPVMHQEFMKNWIS